MKSNTKNFFDKTTTTLLLTQRQIKLNESIELFEKMPTLEKYPIKKLYVLHAVLSDKSLENPLDIDENTSLEESEDSLAFRINNQLKSVERILNLPDEIPSTVIDSHLFLINTYGYRSFHRKGRMYGFRNTMTPLSRQCRFYLFKDLYFDVDLKNAHPTILYSYAMNNNLTVEVLEKYVLDREAFMGEFMSAEGLSRSEAKVSILRCLNLVTDSSIPKFLVGLHKDVLVIREHLYELNLRKKVTLLGEYTRTRESFKNKTPEQQKVSLQSQYCATEESRSLKVLYEVCLKKGLLNREVTLNTTAKSIFFIPFFDGAYIKFDDLKKVSEVEQIIRDTNELINPYTFELKAIEPEWDYLDSTLLNQYEIILSFLGSLNEKQNSLLLDFLNLPEFSLDDSTLDQIVKKTELETGVLGSNPTPLGRQSPITFSDSDLNQLIEVEVKKYKFLVRRTLLKCIEDGRFSELKAFLNIR